MEAAQAVASIRSVVVARGVSAIVMSLAAPKGGDYTN
jgi:hypothetical protein